MGKKKGILDRQLCIEMAKELKYVSWQTPGSILKASIKDDEMVQVWLSARVIRQIGRLVNEVERIERDAVKLTA